MMKAVVMYGVKPRTCTSWVEWAAPVRMVTHVENYTAVKSDQPNCLYRTYRQICFHLASSQRQSANSWWLCADQRGEAVVSHRMVLAIAALFSLVHLALSSAPSGRLFASCPPLLPTQM